jgi:ribonuclease HI
MTNNVAEYRALIATLEYARNEYPGRPVDVHGDSQLTIRQMTGEYAVRSDTIRPLWREAKSLARQLDVSFQWVPREENERADALSKQAYENHALEDGLEERRQRAREEDMDIEPLNDETYRVKGEYRVDLVSRTCTCPDYENQDHACKHIFAVGQYVESS